MLDRLSSDISKIEGSITYDHITPVSIELALAYSELDRVLSLGFAETSNMEYLKYRASEHGVEVKEPSCSRGQIKISGEEGTQIEKGSSFVTESGIQFTTDDSAVISETGYIVVSVSSVQVGIMSNVSANTITKVLFQIPGVASVTNESETTGGMDEEKPESLLERLLEKVRNPATSGNVSHYKQWTKEVLGVGDCKVIPTWNGNGTVKVVVIDTDKSGASQVVIDDVIGHLEAERPIGAVVTVISATEVAINVIVDLDLDPNYSIEEVQGNIEDSINTYLKELAFKQNYISHARIGSAILDVNGIIDYSGLLLNGSTGNITLSDDEVAVLGMVTIS